MGLLMTKAYDADRESISIALDLRCVRVYPDNTHRYCLTIKDNKYFFETKQQLDRKGCHDLEFHKFVCTLMDNWIASYADGMETG